MEALVVRGPRCRPGAGCVVLGYGGAVVTDLTLLRDREAASYCDQFERGRVAATLQDAIEWERLGLGRLFFVDGVPTWHPAASEPLA